MRIECPECKSFENRVVSRHTGEVVCLRCHYQWKAPELSAALSTPFVQPYITHVVVSPADLGKMEEASGFKQSPLPKIAISTVPKRSIIRWLTESLEDNIVLQIILMILVFIVLTVIATWIENSF